MFSIWYTYLVILWVYTVYYTVYCIVYCKMSRTHNGWLLANLVYQLLMLYYAYIYTNQILLLKISLFPFTSHIPHQVVVTYSHCLRSQVATYYWSIFWWYTILLKAPFLFIVSLCFIRLVWFVKVNLTFILFVLFNFI